MDDQRIGEVLALLHSYEFLARPFRKGVRRFTGNLQCMAGPVPIELSIHDWDFQTYPEIRITTPPPFLPPKMAHSVVGGTFCYFADGSIVLDRYNPASAVALCLKQATSVIDDLVSDPARSTRDIQAEFQAYWTGSTAGSVHPIALGEVSPGALRSPVFRVPKEMPFSDFISDSSASVESLCKSWNTNCAELTRHNCWLFYTNITPLVTSAPLAWSIKAALTWLKEWDTDLYRQFTAALEQDPVFLKSSRIYIAIKSPIGWIGFGFLVNQRDLKRIAPSNAKGKRKANGKAFRQYLHTYGGGAKIFRLDIFDLQSEFVHSRNIDSTGENYGLSGLNIVLIGCGSIGGYVAQAAARLGAGTNGGELTLIDNQLLRPENLGRHALGFHALFTPKADAMKSELERQFPYGCFKSKTHKITSPLNFHGADLIINVTGEEAVSEMLNEYMLTSADSPPVLHAWIKGNGECVQALWTDKGRFGCFRCLRTEKTMEERFKSLKGEVVKGFRACQHFTPYAVSAPLAAASLVSDVLVDWRRHGDPSPRFRTRSTESANIFKVKNQNIEPLSGCPACGAR